MSNYTVTDQNITNEIQYHLLEAPNNGASYGSGLFTAAEVAGILNMKLQEFAKLSGYLVDVGGAFTNANSVGVISLSANVMDVIRVAFTTPSNTIIAIPLESLAPADNLISSLANSSTSAVDVPSIASTSVRFDTPQITFWPPPNAGSVVSVQYTKRPTALPATPNGTVLDCPNDFTPFVKYGALASLFYKSGETYDPARAELCQAIFDLGVTIVRQWVGELP